MALAITFACLLSFAAELPDKCPMTVLPSPDISLASMSPVNGMDFMKVSMALKNLGTGNSWVGANVSFLGLHISILLCIPVGCPSPATFSWLL